MQTETKYKIFRILCLLPFYFGIVTLITYLISDYYHMLSFDSIPPKPPEEPLTKTLIIELKKICAKLFYIHYISLLLYCSLSFPIIIYLTKNLYMTSKRNVTILCLLYLIIPIYLLVFYQSRLFFI
jgi:hypothetical protein